MTRTFPTTRWSWRLALAGALLAGPRPAAAEPATRLLLLPMAVRGEVRPIQLRRVETGLRDTLGFGGAISVITDATPVAPSEPGKVKPTAVDPRLERADAQRQEGTDLATDGKHAAALAKLEAAIAGYQGAFADLVDFTKLADAYARAGVAAWQAGKGPKRAAAHFDAGLTLQPTLAIDRRKADKELLALFDGRRAALEAAPRGVIRVEGPAVEAEVFVDGVRIGSLPAQRDELLAGDHYVQVRAEGFVPFAKRVQVKGKVVAVLVKLKARPEAAPGAKPAIVTLDALKPCTETGEMNSKSCVSLAKGVAGQTAVTLLLHPLLVADRYGRLTLHCFLQRDDGKVIALQPREIDKNLADVAARLTEVATEASGAARAFPEARALSGKPKIFR